MPFVFYTVIDKGHKTRGDDNARVRELEECHGNAGAILTLLYQLLRLKFSNHLSTWSLVVPNRPSFPHPPFHMMTVDQERCELLVLVKLIRIDGKIFPCENRTS